MKRLLIVIISLFLFANQARAQEPLIFTSATLTRLTQDYLFQAAAYQKARDQFGVDRAEFRQLQTLVSREEVVASYKTMASSRALTQLAYLAALEQLLAETVGVDPVEKARVLEMLNQSRSLLLAHETELSPILDPQQINNKAAEIRDSMAFVYKTQYTLLALIALSRAEYAYDQTVTLTNSFESTNVISQQNPSLRDFLTRGMNDVKLQNTRANDVLTQSKVSYDKMFTKDNRGNEADPLEVYEEVVDTLQPFLGFANQSIRYLRELERQVLRENGSK